MGRLESCKRQYSKNFTSESQSKTSVETCITGKKRKKPNFVWWSSETKTDKKFWFLTSELELSTKEATDYYRKRWDIKVFFRFLRKELNLSHLVFPKRLLIYKKANHLGYKTTKRRIA